MINQVILVGRTGAEPVIRGTATSSVANFTLATSESRLVKEEWVETTEWHNITCFGKIADRMKDLPKGTLLFIQGKIHYSVYDKKDGSKGYKTEIWVNNVKFLEKKKKFEDVDGDAPPPQRKTSQKPSWGKGKVDTPWGGKPVTQNEDDDDGAPWKDSIKN